MYGKRFTERYKTSKDLKGRTGEIMVGQMISQLKSRMFLRFMDNVNLPSARGIVNCSSDFVLLCRKGFFTIEVKNWMCTLYCGSPEDLGLWKAQYASKEVMVKNPIIQTKWHADMLTKMTGEQWVGLVLFAGGTQLENNHHSGLMYAGNLPRVLLSMPDIYTEEQVKRVSEIVYDLRLEARYSV